MPKRVGPGEPFSNEKGRYEHAILVHPYMGCSDRGMLAPLSPFWEFPNLSVK